MKHHPARHRGHQKRVRKREKRLATFAAVQALLAIIKIILWLCMQHHHW